MMLMPVTQTPGLAIDFERGTSNLLNIQGLAPGDGVGTNLIVKADDGGLRLRMTANVVEPRVSTL